MKFRAIRFSHKEYIKFNGIDIDKPIKLLEVFPTHTNELSDTFKNYDTKYIIQGREYFYPLKDMPCIVLLFQDINGKLFTTIRSHSVNKRKYYNQHIGYEFKIKLENF